MEEIKNGTESVNQEERTFTQEEVNRIIQKRLQGYDEIKAKAQKFDEMEEANKTELQKAMGESAKYKAELEALQQANTVRDIRQSVAEKNGIPASLLNGSTEEECETQAKAILEFANKPAPYPSVQDGGEVQKPMKKSAVDQFTDWFNAQ